MNFAGAAGREHRGPRNYFANFVRVAIERVNAPACAGLACYGSFDEQIDRDVIFQRADIRARRGGLGERAHYFAAGQILRMQHSAMAMAAFLTEIVFELGVEFVSVEGTIFDPGEMGAETNQLAHCFGSFADNCLDCVAVAETRAGANCIFDM